HLRSDRAADLFGHLPGRRFLTEKEACQGHRENDDRRDGEHAVVGQRGTATRGVVGDPLQGGFLDGLVNRSQHGRPPGEGVSEAMPVPRRSGRVTGAPYSVQRASVRGATRSRPTLQPFPHKLLLLLSLACTLLNAVKPLTIDDTAYHSYAVQVAEKPLDP